MTVSGFFERFEESRDGGWVEVRDASVQLDSEEEVNVKIYPNEIRSGKLVDVSVQYPGSSSEV